MRHFIKYLCSLLLLLHFESYAQQPSPGEKIVFSSPQAAQLGKFGGHTINYSTGTPNINIPLLTLSEGDLQIPISVQYNYSGFRPSDQPGWIGLGFSLIAGGVVSRHVKGFADELTGFGFLSHPTAVANFANLTSPTYTSFQTNIENNNDVHADIYSFQFNGYSGKMVIDQNGVPKVVSDARIKIEYLIGTKSDHGNSNQIIKKWTFTVENGTKYIFNNMEFTGNGGPDNDYVPSAWHLSEIVDIKGNRISFEYTAPVISTAGRRIQYGRFDQDYAVTYSGGYGVESSTVISQNKTEEIYLTKIKGSNWELAFNSETYSHSTGTVSEPIKGGKLNNIQLFSTTVTPFTKVKQFTFDYLSDISASLQLQKITEDGSNPYIMGYYASAPSGLRGADANIDYWGYYNGVSNTSLIPQTGADLEPRLAATLSGALTSLTYPTTGYTAIEYEQNTYSYVQNAVTTASRIVVDEYYHHRKWNAGTSSLDQDGFTSIVLTAPARVDVRLNNASVAPAPTNCTSQGTFISQTLSAGTYTPTQILTLFNFYPCNQAEAAMSGFEITLNVKVFKTVASNTANYGGVRVKTLTDYPAIPSNAPASVNSFTYADASNVLLSSGVIAKEPTYQLSFLNSIGSHSLYRSTAFNPEALSPLYYKNVKVSTSAYETTHSFTSHGDQTDTKGKWGFFFDKGIGGIGTPGILFNESAYLEMGDFGNYYFMRSLPKEVVVKDIAGNLKQKTTYEYTGYNQDVFQVPAIHYELLARYEVPLAGGSMDSRSVYYGKAYYIIGGWPRKISETITNYGSDGTNPVTTTINYAYGTNHLQLNKQRTTQSDGTTEETNFKYPLDYSASANTVIQSMIAANMVNYPLEQVTWLEKSPSDRKVIDANLTTYNTFTGNPTNHVLPYKKFRFNGLNGTIGTFANYDGSSNENASASYREILKFTHYDTQGNPLSLLINGGEKISYLWSYKGQHPVAEIQNADNAELVSALGGTTFSQMADMTDSPTIKTKLDAVRTALSGSLVSSYQYKPTEGISAITDPAGKNLVYEYDGYGRLKYIKDNAGNIRSSYCYNYAGQSMLCDAIAATGTVSPSQLFLLANQGGPLPVTLVNFNAIKEEATALLTWNTTAETNSERFDVERSLNGKDWSRIGSVDAKGESVSMQYYSFKDGSPVSGAENLYRLKMVDRDNTFAYSRIQSLIFDNQVSVYPNPVTFGEKLNLDTPDPDKISHVKIYDVRGKLVFSENKPGRQIDVSSLQAGVYMVQLTGMNGAVSTHRIVKQ